MLSATSGFVNKVQNYCNLFRDEGVVRSNHLEEQRKGDIYEGVLEKNSQGYAGQYFTPRVLIDAIVEVMRPKPGTTIIDPAAGTGGFLLTAATYIIKHHTLDPDQTRHLETGALYAVELVAATARLCAMNLLLHGLGIEKNIVATKRTSTRLSSCDRTGQYLQARLWLVRT